MKSKMSLTQSVTRVGIELSPTLVWTAKKQCRLCAFEPNFVHVQKTLPFVFTFELHQLITTIAWVLSIQTFLV